MAVKEKASSIAGLWDVDDLMLFLKVKRNTLYKLIYSKTDPLPSIKVGNLRRFQPEKVRWWLENREVL